MIDGRDELWACGRRLAMLQLHRGRRRMVLMRHPLLLGCRLNSEAARTAGIADAIYGDVVDHRLGVDVLNLNMGDVVGFAVVPEAVVAPVTAFVTTARIPVAVVHSTIKPDLRPPVPAVPHEKSL